MPSMIFNIKTYHALHASIYTTFYEDINPIFIKTQLIIQMIDLILNNNLFDMIHNRD